MAGSEGSEGRRQSYCGATASTLFPLDADTCSIQIARQSPDIDVLARHSSAPPGAFRLLFGAQLRMACPVSRIYVIFNFSQRNWPWECSSNCQTTSIFIYIAAHRSTPMRTNCHKGRTAEPLQFSVLSFDEEKLRCGVGWCLLFLASKGKS